MVDSDDNSLRHAGARLTAADYQTLATFRHALRKFIAFSETEAALAGLMPQQHQALLAIKAMSRSGAPSVGEVAEYLMIRPHSAVELRSEEHTSELQSLMRISYAVFCLKKKKKTMHNTYNQHDT